MKHSIKEHLTIIPTTSDLIVMVDSTFGLHLPDRLQFEIERLWVQEQQKDPDLYNGKYLCAIKYDSNIIYGHFVEYKHYLGNILSAEFRKSLDLTFVYIFGITHYQKNILIGKRSKHVSHYPGHYDLAPSGGINSNYIFESVIDYRHQLLDELEDETSLTQEQVVDFRPLLLCHNKKDGMLGICVEIHLNNEAVHHLAETSVEYDEFHWVSEANVKSFVSGVGPWTPQSKDLLEIPDLFGLLE
jgi:hypothetical protein